MQAVTFQKSVDSNAADTPNVAALVEALRAEPGQWFDITSVTFSLDESTQRTLGEIKAAAEAQLGGTVQLQAPAGRGYAKVRWSR